MSALGPVILAELPTRLARQRGYRRHDAGPPTKEGLEQAIESPRELGAERRASG